MEENDFELQLRHRNRRFGYMTMIFVAIFIVGISLCVLIVRVLGGGGLGVFLCAAVFLGFGFAGDAVLKKLPFPEQETLIMREKALTDASGFIPMSGAMRVSVNPNSPRVFEYSQAKAKSMRWKRVFAGIGPKFAIGLIVVLGIAMVVLPALCVANSGALESFMKSNDGDGWIVATIIVGSVFAMLFIVALSAFFISAGAKEPFPDEKIERIWVDQAGFLNHVEGYVLSNGEVRTTFTLIRPDGFQAMIDRETGSMKLYGYMAEFREADDGYRGFTAEPVNPGNKFEYTVLEVPDYFEPSFANALLVA